MQREGCRGQQCAFKGNLISRPRPSHPARRQTSIKIICENPTLARRLVVGCRLSTPPDRSLQFIPCFIPRSSFVRYRRDGIIGKLLKSPIFSQPFILNLFFIYLHFLLKIVCWKNYSVMFHSKWFFSKYCCHVTATVLQNRSRVVCSSVGSRVVKILLQGRTVLYTYRKYSYYMVSMLLVGYV